MNAPLRVAVVGTGRMGRELARLAPERGCVVVATIARGTPIDVASLGGAQVALEFTEPAAAAANVRALLRTGCAVVSGTTGWEGGLREVRDEAAQQGGTLLWAANFSLGANILESVAAHVGQLLAGAPFDAHVLEIHHAAKKDAPSGTARLLAGAAGAALGREVPVTSVRTGHVPGTHALVFDAPFEQLRLEHEVRDRRVFAEGALVAARWVAGRRGIFAMRDVLALTGEAA